jgi:hypothetical protein
MKIDRVIVASDENPLYTQFWPAVAESWSLLGIKPTLFLVSNDISVDESIGDVVRVKPLDGIPTSLQAQCVRLLAPTMFPEDVSVTSDIDMMPLSREYFVDTVADIKNDDFVIFSSDAYENIPNFPCFPICYNAALGSVFGEIFGFTMNEYEEAMKKWQALGQGWTTDERVLYSQLKSWSGYDKRCTRLRRGWTPLATARVDRVHMQFDPRIMMARKYIDFHMLRPYDQYKEIIDYILACLKASRKSIALGENT